MPVDTSSLMRSVASSNRAFPVAPATDSIASTKGTPAANIVDNVRANLAMADFSNIFPITGTLSAKISMPRLTAGERFLALINANTAIPIANNIIHHQFCINSDSLMTNKVNAGRSAPNPWKSSWN